MSKIVSFYICVLSKLTINIRCALSKLWYNRDEIKEKLPMILRRKIYDKLLLWKNECRGTKAILLEGARRIGKSTIVKEFAKNEYKSYLLIDFANVSNNIINIFDNYKDKLDCRTALYM